MTELDTAVFADILTDLEAIQNELFDGVIFQCNEGRHYKLIEEPIEALKRIDA